jgi:hypothetical protein
MTARIAPQKPNPFPPPKPAPEHPTYFANPTPTTSIPTTPPVIQINCNNPATFNIGDTHNDLGATITGPQADLNFAA